MTKTYKISKKQSLLDACIQVYGTAHLLYTLAKDNGLSIDSVVEIGDELTYDEDLGVPKMKRALIRADKDVLNNTGKVTYSSWFLASLDLLQEMYDQLKAFGFGNFLAPHYWSSSEHNNLGAKYVDFGTGIPSFNTKSWTDPGVRACRVFTATVGAYNLRDIGPAGGYIFYIDGATYYESSPSDQSISHAWSKIDSVLRGTTGTAIGTGQGNTDDIIAQPGHTDSAAKLCNDLIISN